MDRQTVVIRKYENRRLYDTANSRYVNLDEVAEMVRQGADVQVVDAATGEDITRLVLTQIIVDHAKAPGSAFPLDMLRQMVVASGRLGQESMLKSMRAMFDMYQSAYRTFSAPLNPLDFFNAMSQAAQPGAGEPQGPPPAKPSPAAEPDQAAPESEVRELRRRIEELESLVAGPGARTVRKRKKKSARRR